MSANWNKLVAQGRAKAIGVPWSEEELHAIYELRVPPEHVRNGILTKEGSLKAATSPESKYKKLAELQAEATELGVTFSPQTTRAELLELIAVAKEAPDSSDQGKDPGSEESADGDDESAAPEEELATDLES